MEAASVAPRSCTRRAVARRPTTRCSGLATLAAELDIVRPFTAVFLFASDRAFVVRSFRACLGFLKRHSMASRSQLRGVLRTHVLHPALFPPRPGTLSWAARLTCVSALQVLGRSSFSAGAPRAASTASARVALRPALARPNRALQRARRQSLRSFLLAAERGIVRRHTSCFFSSLPSSPAVKTSS